MGLVIEARPELESNRIERDLFEDKTRVGLRLDRRKKCFLAQSGEICLLRLIAKDSFERTELFVRNLDSPIVAFVFENGPDVRSFEFRVGVIRIAELVGDRLDRLERLLECAAERPIGVARVRWLHPVPRRCRRLNRFLNRRFRNSLSPKRRKRHPRRPRFR